MLIQQPEPTEPTEPTEPYEPTDPDEPTTPTNPGYEPEPTEPLPCGCVELLGLTKDINNETALKLHLIDPLNVPDSIYLVGFPCNKEVVGCDIQVEDKYYDLVNLINSASDDTEKGYLTKTLMKLIRENTMTDGLIVNQVAYDEANDAFNQNPPYKIDDHQIFLHNLKKQILVKTDGNELVKSGNKGKIPLTELQANEYKFMIFCESQPAETNEPVEDCSTNWTVCTDDCCYDFSTIRSPSQICISNGSGVGLFTSSDCCCVTDLYTELLNAQENSNIDLGLDLVGRYTKLVYSAMLQVQ